MSPLLVTEITVVFILMVVALVALLVRYVRIPYTVALVLAGLALSLIPQWRLTLTPELVLGLFVPPLVFEAAFHLQLRDLRAVAVPVGTMAMLGVALSTVLIGWGLSTAGVLPWNVALLFGALISATDPVAVVALFRALGAPQRLTTLLEGESLFNDGTAIVLFQIMTLLVLEGMLDPVAGLVKFVQVAAGGIVIGLALGYLVAALIARIDDYLIETTLTTVLAYGAYLTAEQVHVSGVLAVVAAGLVNGNLGPRGMSPTTRIVVFNFWEYIAFVANSFVFLLIGMNVKWQDMIVYAPAIGVAIGVVILARAVTVYGTATLLRWTGQAPPAAYQHVLFWGGLRGAISLALALTLMEHDIPAREEILALTVGVVLFTLLVQGTTVRFLVERLGLVRYHPVRQAYERLQGELLALRAARRHIDRLREEGALIPQAWQHVTQRLTVREQELEQAIARLVEEHPSLEKEAIALAWEEALRAQRAALLHLAQEGLLSADVIHDLVAQIDTALVEPSTGQSTDDELPSSGREQERVT